MITRKLCTVLLVMAIALLPRPAASEDTIPETGISLTADRMSSNQTDESFTARGNVKIIRDRMILTADEATYYRKTREIRATGNIALNVGEDTLRGTSLKLSLENGRGELENGTLNIKQGNISFTGEKIVRVDDSHLLIQQTELTTCDLPDPFWKFGAEELNINLLGYATGRNVVFYIRNAPVLYLPWIAFPVVRDRKSGILFPRFGYSKSRGAEVDIPLYWVISPNQDLQLDLDFQTRRGIGAGADYRYARKRGSEGNVGGYLIYDLVKEQWRGQLQQGHQEIFSRTMNLRSTIDLTSDRSFYSDYGEKSGDYNRQSGDSTIIFLKTWQSFALTAGLRYTEDLYAADNKRTLQTLPEAGLASVRQRLFDTPLFFDLDSALSNFYRETGARGVRLYAFPRLTLVTGRAGYLHLSAYSGGHIRAYNTSNIKDDSDIEGNDSSFVPEFGATLSSSLVKIYEPDGTRLKKLRHELVPAVSYQYAPDLNQSRLPFYDYNDRIIHQNTIYYSLTSHLGGKFANGDSSEYRDISRVRLMQGYSFEGKRADLQAQRDLLTLVDDGRPLTDLMLESETWLHPFFRVLFDARYNVNVKQISSAQPGIEYDDRRGNTASVGYRLSRNQLEYFEGRLGTKFFHPVTLNYTTRYSFDRQDFLESVYSVEYRHQCWSVNLALRDRPGNQSFTVNFNLAGLTGK